MRSKIAARCAGLAREPQILDLTGAVSPRALGVLGVLGDYQPELLRAINHLLVMAARKLMVGAMGPPIGVQDLKWTPRVLRSIRVNWPWLSHVFADAAKPG